MGIRRFGGKLRKVGGAPVVYKTRRPATTIDVSVLRLSAGTGGSFLITPSGGFPNDYVVTLLSGTDVSVSANSLVVSASALSQDIVLQVTNNNSEIPANPKTAQFTIPLIVGTETEVARLSLFNETGTAQTDAVANVAVGFAPGAFDPNTHFLRAYLEGDETTPLPFTVDHLHNKRYDGSARFAFLTTQLPTLPANPTAKIIVKRNTGTRPAQTPVTMAELYAKNYDVRVTINDATDNKLSPVVYTSTLRSALEFHATQPNPETSQRYVRYAETYMGRLQATSRQTEFVFQDSPKTVGLVVHNFLRIEYQIKPQKNRFGQIVGAKLHVEFMNGWLSNTRGSSPSNSAANKSLHFGYKIEVNDGTGWQTVEDRPILRPNTGLTFNTYDADGGAGVEPRIDAVTVADTNVFSFANNTYNGYAIFEVGGPGVGYFQDAISAAQSKMTDRVAFTGQVIPTFSLAANNWIITQFLNVGHHVMGPFKIGAYAEALSVPNWQNMVDARVVPPYTLSQAAARSRALTELNYARPVMGRRLNAMFQDPGTHDGANALGPGFHSRGAQDGEEGHAYWHITEIAGLRSENKDGRDLLTYSNYMRRMLANSNSQWGPGFPHGLVEGTNGAMISWKSAPWVGTRDAGSGNLFVTFHNVFQEPVVPMIGHEMAWHGPQGPGGWLCTGEYWALKNIYHSLGVAWGSAASVGQSDLALTRRLNTIGDMGRVTNHRVGLSMMAEIFMPDVLDGFLNNGLPRSEVTQFAAAQATNMIASGEDYYGVGYYQALHPTNNTGSSWYKDGSAISFLAAYRAGAFDSLGPNSALLYNRIVNHYKEHFTNTDIFWEAEITKYTSRRSGRNHLDVWATDALTYMRYAASRPGSGNWYGVNAAVSLDKASGNDIVMTLTGGSITSPIEKILGSAIHFGYGVILKNVTRQILSGEILTDSGGNNQRTATGNSFLLSGSYGSNATAYVPLASDPPDYGTVYIGGLAVGGDSAELPDTHYSANPQVHARIVGKISNTQFIISTVEGTTLPFGPVLSYTANNWFMHHIPRADAALLTDYGNVEGTLYPTYAYGVYSLLEAFGEPNFQTYRQAMEAHFNAESFDWNNEYVIRNFSLRG
jgi:hypothetical protein